MASITRQSNGRRMLQFLDSDGERRTVRLGKMAQRNAEAVKLRVEHLVAASIAGHSVDDDTARWLAGLGDKLRNRLAATGLIPKKEAATLVDFIDSYIRRRHDVKASTTTVYGHTRRNLIEHFGEEKPLREITPGDTDEWRLGLIKQHLADNTIRRRCGIAKQFFRAAVRKGLIPANPFADLAAAVRANKGRFFFITRPMASRVLDACPDAEWRLIFALSRFAGLRCPSEHLSLRWMDVDWERGRITVPSPKTEHHEGGESRQIPIFPEVLPYLREVFEDADEGTEFVIARYRSTCTNLRTRMTRIGNRHTKGTHIGK